MPEQMETAMTANKILINRAPVLTRVASAIVCDGVSAAAVVFAPEYGNEDEHPI
jgi:hypothetical protein